VENCDDPKRMVLYEQPVWQTLQMFSASSSYVLAILVRVTNYTSYNALVSLLLRIPPIFGCNGTPRASKPRAKPYVPAQSERCSVRELLSLLRPPARYPPRTNRKSIAYVVSNTRFPTHHLCGGPSLHPRTEVSARTASGSTRSTASTTRQSAWPPNPRAARMVHAAHVASGRMRLGWHDGPSFEVLR
jgi:hypothetical protein